MVGLAYKLLGILHLYASFSNVQVRGVRQHLLRAEETPAKRQTQNVFPFEIFFVYNTCITLRTLIHMNSKFRCIIVNPIIRPVLLFSACISLYGR